MSQIYLLEAGSIAQVLRAKCETCARSVAADTAGAEGPAVWRDPSRSTCKRVTETGKSGVVLRRDL